VAASAAEVTDDDQIVSGGHDLGDPDLATRGQVNDVKQPRVAKKSSRKSATRGKTVPMDEIAAWKANRQKTQQPELATRGKKLVSKKTRKGIGEWRVDAVKASAGTWAFRLRRRENGVRSKPIYVSRVANAVYEMIREEDYDSFKEQLIASHMPGTVRASNRA